MEGNLMIVSKTLTMNNSKDALFDFDNYDKEYLSDIRELIRIINGFSNAVIVGITGSYLRRKQKDLCLRVYINGSPIMTIPLKPMDKIEILNKSYIEADNINLKIKGKLDYFENEKVLKRTIEIKNYVGNDFRKLKDDDDENNKYALLKEYLGYIIAATNKKFGKLETSKKDNAKERKYQIDLFKTALNNDNIFMNSDLKTTSEEFAFVDVEFQSVWEMNYETENDKNQWLLYNHKRKKAHCSKPDFIAICNRGFILIELKTNEASLTGNAGVKDHETDIDKLILLNKKNHILAKELIYRLNIMYFFGLLNPKYNMMAEKVLNTKPEELALQKRFLFLLNEDLTHEKCGAFIQNEKIDKKEVLFVDSKNINEFYMMN